MLSKADQLVVDRDRGLPGLGVVLNDEAVGALLAERMGISASGLRGVYVRYKPGVSCMVGYELQGAEGHVQRFYARAHRLQDQNKIVKERRAVGVVGSSDVGRIVLEDQAVVVFVFPRDHELLSIEKLISPPEHDWRKRVFKKDRSFDDAKARVLRYKPERRLVVELCSTKARSVVKCYRPADFDLAYGNACFIEQAGGIGRGEVITPRLLGRSMRHKMMAFSWVKGKAMQELLEQRNRAMLEELGSVLSSLHKMPGNLDVCWEPATEIGAMESACSLLAWLDPELGDQSWELSAKLSAMLSSKTWARQPIHGDMSADQILVGDEGLCVLDFDRACMGPAERDLGSFWAWQLAYASYSQDSDHTGQEIKALCAGYEKGGGELDREGVKLFAAVGLVQRALEPFRRRSVGWNYDAGQLLERARKLIDNVA